MPGFLKRYWPALVLAALMLAVFDAVISSLLTCHPITSAGSANAGHDKQQECTALAGPIFLSLVAAVDFFDHHGEAVTGIFTIFLALFTGRLWWSTNELWKVTRVAAEHIPRVERAYVWGGFGAYDKSTSAIFPAAHNDGKTPCTLNYVSVACDFIDKLPQHPSYPKRKFVNLNLPPDGKNVVIKESWAFAKEPARDARPDASNSVFSTPPEQPEQVFYGRFWYTDIFGDEHTSGFILHLENGMAAVEGFPEYWKWT